MTKRMSKVPFDGRGGEVALAGVIPPEGTGVLPLIPDADLPVAGSVVA